LSAESLLNGFVGGKLAVLAVAGPLAIYAYWVIAVRWWLSPTSRAEIRSFLVRAREQRTHTFMFAVFCGLFLVSIPRAVVAGSVDPLRGGIEMARWVAVLVLLLTLAGRAVSARDEGALIRPVVVALGAYVVVNVILLLLGVANDVLRQQVIAAPEAAVMLQALGVKFTRTVLPLGSATGGIQVATGFAIGVALLRTDVSAGWRALAILLLLGSVWCVLATDSRGGMLAGVVGAVAVLLPSAARQQLRWLAPLVVLLPAALILGVGALSNGSMLEGVSRAGESSVGALSGRPLIWGTILVFLLSFNPRHLFGYGAVGQIASGVNAQYAFLFSTSYANTDSIGAHNTVLQAVLELGYVGAGVMLFAAWLSLRRCAELSKEPGEASVWGFVGLAIGVSVLVLGTTDATVSMGTPNTLVMFMALNLHCIVAGARGRGAEPGQ